jgi:hypothetical protein
MVGSGWASGSFAASSHAASARAPASTGALVAGTTTTWQWTYPSTTFTARVRAEHTRILVSIADGPEIVVQIDHAPTNYGGDRPYFLCPGCATRRWHLDVQGHALVCRVCCKLDYRSRYEFWSPALRRAIKLRRRLGAEPVPFGPLPPRPPYPACRTYDRLVARLATFEKRAHAAFTNTLAAIERHSRRIRR